MKELKKPLKKGSEQFTLIYPWMLNIMVAKELDQYALYVFAVIYNMSVKKETYVWVDRTELKDCPVSEKFAKFLGIPFTKVTEAIKELIVTNLVNCEHDADYNYFSVNLDELKELGVNA